MSEKPINPLPGDVYAARYPFVRTTFYAFDYEADKEIEVPSWKPGVEFEDAGPYGEDMCALADGVGQVEFTVVDIHKPGRFPTRVFFTRKFVTPDGKTFGKGGLRICTLEKFRRLAKGYRFAFEMRSVASLA